jgi:hypothetical protein
MAKFRALARRGFHKSKELGGKAISSGIGGEVLEAGSHALLALATKQAGSTLPVRPDAGAAIISAGVMMLAKGGSRKIARKIFKGAVHALISRAVYTGQITIVAGPNGEYNAKVVDAEAVADAA